MSDSAMDHLPPFDSLAADAVTAGYQQRAILHGLDLTVRRGEIVALVGPNGSGKSTLLKTLARLLRPAGGAVYLDGRSIARLSTAEVARRLAVLPQGPVTPPGLTVFELVEQGRYPHTGPLRPGSAADRAAVWEALDLTGITYFAHRPLDTLSGGERQRAWIALTLAQSTAALLLDEPTTFLDVGHQLDVLTLVERLNRERGMTIVLVLHDLNHAARFATRMVALCAGRVVADGPPAAVLTAGLLAEVFGVRATVITDPVSGAPACLPYASLTGPPSATADEAGPRLGQTGRA
jgi:iron complex transport system ATP-binding protein